MGEKHEARQRAWNDVDEAQRSLNRAWDVLKTSDQQELAKMVEHIRGLTYYMHDALANDRNASMRDAFEKAAKSFSRK